MLRFNVIKPFVYQEPGSNARVVEAGEQPLSRACVEHARKIGALREPEIAAVAPQGEEPTPGAADQSRPAKPRK